MLQFRAGKFHVRRDRVQVQLQRVGAGLLNLFREARPAARRRAVQAGDDGNHHRLLGILDVPQIGLRADEEFGRLRKIAERFGITLRSLGGAPVQLVTFVANLLLE